MAETKRIPIKKKQTKRKACSLSELYNNLNAADQKTFRQYCIDTYRVKLRAVQSWISGDSFPGYVEKVGIAAYFKTSVDEIWEPLTTSSK